MILDPATCILFASALPVIAFGELFSEDDIAIYQYDGLNCQVLIKTTLKEANLSTIPTTYTKLRRESWIRRRKEERRSAGFGELFRFANRLDYVLMAIGTVGDFGKHMAGEFTCLGQKK